MSAWKKNITLANLLTTQPMKLLLALLAGLALTAYILALADGPSLVDIINKY